MRQLPARLLVPAIPLLFGVGIIAGCQQGWTGFQDKTLWSWLELLIVPAVLAIGAFLFNRAERRAARERGDERAEVERLQAKEKAADEALARYLEAMTHLLLEQGLSSASDAAVRDVARARTLAVLESVESARKATVVEFLHKAGLLRKPPVVSMERANLGGIEFYVGSDLKGINLAGAWMNGAGLIGADLSSAELSGTQLRGSGLMGADLRGANLAGAMMGEGTLAELLMIVGEFTKAETEVLYGRAMADDPELREKSAAETIDGANLRAARVTDRQLSQAYSLFGATMPDGSRYDGRFQLPGDILQARNRGIRVEDEEAMARWYAGKDAGVVLGRKW